MMGTAKKIDTHAVHFKLYNTQKSAHTRTSDYSHPRLVLLTSPSTHTSSPALLYPLLIDHYMDVAGYIH